jgi:hypothetical protein
MTRSSTWWLPPGALTITGSANSESPVPAPLPESALVPPLVRRPGLATAADLRHRVLAIGPVEDDLLAELGRWSQLVRHVSSWQLGKRIAETEPADSIVLTPGADGQGLSIVTDLKNSTDHVPHLRLTPIFVTSPRHALEPEYAIVVQPPDFSYFEDGIRRPLVETIFRLQVPVLLASDLLRS